MLHVHLQLQGRAADHRGRAHPDRVHLPPQASHGKHNQRTTTPFSTYQDPFFVFCFLGWGQGGKPKRPYLESP